MSSWRRTSIGILLSTAVWAGVLVGIELVVRAKLPEIDTRSFFLELFGDPPDTTPKGQQRLFEGDPVVFWRLTPDAKEVWWDFTIVSTNSDGVRHSRPLTAKTPGTLRIVCIGDSVTFGYRIPLAFPDHPDQYDRSDGPYSFRLEKILAEANPGRTIEVVNLSVPGYSTHQGQIMLDRFLDLLEPDLVIICFGFNDATPRHRPDRELMPLGPFDVTLRRVMSSSQALLHLWNWQKERAEKEEDSGGGGEMVSRVSREDYVENVLAMAAEARSAGAKVLVVGAVYGDPIHDPAQATRMRDYRQALESACERKGIPFLEIPELTAPGERDHKYFGEPIHPNTDGHILMTERILEFIGQHRLLPFWTVPPPPAQQKG